MGVNTSKLSFRLFLTTILVFTGIAWFSFLRLGDLITTTKHVTSINQTRLDLTRLVKRITAAESSQRGFLLSEDSLFLGPYTTGAPAIQQSFVGLRELLAEDKVQLNRLNELERKVTARLEFLSSNIIKSKTDPIGFEQQMLKGFLFMQEVNRISEVMLATENTKYDIALNQRERYQELTPILFLTVSFFVLALFTLSYLIIRRQLFDRIRFQEELEIQIEALNRSNAELEQFAYVASHDLQEPLRKIQAFGDKLIHRNLISPVEDGIDTVERMRNAASRMQALINELLAFSRLTRPNVVHQFETVALDAIIQQVLGDLQILIQDKKALITLEPMPVLEVIPTQIHQLFQNLLTNALKFSRPDLRPVIRVYADLVTGYMIKGAKSSQATQQFHRITVEDNGIGFDQQYEEKIFVIFQRLHNRKDYAGTGIGLAICRKIVSNHNGYIHAEGKPQEGAKFIVYLPVRHWDFNASA